MLSSLLPYFCKIPQARNRLRGRYFKMRVIRLTRLSSNSQSSYHQLNSFTCASAVVRTPPVAVGLLLYEGGLVKVFVDNLFDPALLYALLPVFLQDVIRVAEAFARTPLVQLCLVVTQFNPLFKWLHSTPYALFFITVSHEEKLEDFQHKVFIGMKLIFQRWLLNRW